MSKEEYKEALRNTIKDIEESIDNIIDYGFSKSTTTIEINLKIEPNEIIGWTCKYSHTTRECYKGETNE